MNIALIDGNTVLRVGDYRSLFPQTSFGNNGPSDAFLAENNALRVNVFRPHDKATEKLVACDPVIEDGWVYTVAVEPLTPEEIEARNDAQSGKVRAERNVKLSECDWTQLADSPLDADAKLAWQLYRETLRMVPEQAGFPWTVEWPPIPS